MRFRPTRARARWAQCSAAVPWLILAIWAGVPGAARAAADNAATSTSTTFGGATTRLRNEALPVATRVVVYKGERRLELLRGNEALRGYRIALGGDPVGHKLFEGDSRTPEGLYRLNARNPRSEFFLSMHVSYPNVADSARARKMGRRPGGMIMVHGQPNIPSRSPRHYESEDWTDGCIALSNADMMEFWLLVPDNTLIDIRP